MKNIYPEYPTFPQDFISSYTCASMTMEEFGIFNWMLMHSWVFSEKPCHLPNDPKRIAWLLRIDEQLIINCLSKYQKWVITNDNQYIYNPRLLSIYKGLCDKSLTYAANRKGKKNKRLKKITIDNQLMNNCITIEQQADNDNDNDNDNELVATREEATKQDNAATSEGDSKGEKAETWKTSLELYQAEEAATYAALIADKEFLEKEESVKKYPDLNILKTMEKAHMYWCEEKAWKRKRKEKTITINWGVTYHNALTQSMNHVFNVKTKPKSQNQIDLEAAIKREKERFGK